MFLKTRKLWLVTLADRLSDRVYQIVRRWEREDCWMIGRQWVRATDSVGANITEGCGRHHPKDVVHFFYIARGSLDEALNWLRRAMNRGLVDPSEFHELLTGYSRLSSGLNALIKARRLKIYP
jgi:four helix bundle protein